VRIAASIGLLLSAYLADAQPRVVINELLASNHSTLEVNGSTPDWIELYNAGNRTAQLAGMRIAYRGRQHVIDAPLSLPPKAYLVLLADAHPERGPEHLGFTLDREGGTVLLIGADGFTITDLFTYPPLPTDVGVGRLPDGAAEWSFFTRTSPGLTNRPGAEGPLRGRAPLPEVEGLDACSAGPCAVHLVAPKNCTVRYTLDGSDPSRPQALTATGPVRVDRTSVLRAQVFAPGKLAGPERCVVVDVQHRPVERVDLVADPHHLWSDSLGILVSGAQANHTRQGGDWERPGHYQDIDGRMSGVQLRISGSGSRGLAKRSLKLYAQDDGLFAFADGTRCDELMLRADAGPHAYLRNRLMEVVVRQHGLALEVQPSEPVDLWLNGTHWGLYRRMPPKDAQWLAQRSGAEAVDVLEGPALVERSGNDKRFLAARDALLAGAPIDSLEAMLDLGSLTDLACMDLYTGRADHDLNVRCYRPRLPGGRWRWVLFDMDLWAPADENSVERMCAASQPETPFVPQLLDHPELQVRLLARLTALQASVLASDHLTHLADSIHSADAHLLEADQARWSAELDRPSPTACLEAMNAFVSQRPEHLFTYLGQRTGRRVARVTVEVPTPDQGRVLLDGMVLPPGRRQVLCLSGIPATLAIKPAAGHEFAGWRGVRGGPVVQVADLSRLGTIAPRFRATVP
jgi:hypothetical protein